MMLPIWWARLETLTLYKVEGAEEFGSGVPEKCLGFWKGAVFTGLSTVWGLRVRVQGTPILNPKS